MFMLMKCFAEDWAVAAVDSVSGGRRSAEHTTKTLTAPELCLAPDVGIRIFEHDAKFRLQR